MIREVLDGKGEIPLILIVGVSVCGTVLLLLNIVLISCFVHKKKKKEEAEHGRKMAAAGGGSDGKAARATSDGDVGEGVHLTSFVAVDFRMSTNPLRSLSLFPLSLSLSLSYLLQI